MYHLSIAFQKLMVYKLTTQKILLAYSTNCKKTTGSLWNCYRDEPSNVLSSDSESFEYKTSITGNNYNIGDSEDNYYANKVGKNETEIVIPLKHLSNFWRTLSIPLINCEVELILTSSKNCVLADMTRKNAQGNNSAINPPRRLEFQKIRHKTVCSSCYFVKRK